MTSFFKRHSARLKTAALILMLVIPFLLHAAASDNSIFLVNFFLVLMGANMLFVMLKG
ncbi:MAG: hypothetical protein P8X85_12170 [Desulfobacterales bacterium]